MTDVRKALEKLPEAYATALHLHLAGATAEAIATQLETDPAAVPNLLEIAHRKMLALLHDPEAD